MIEIVVVSAWSAHPASNGAQNTRGQGHVPEEVEQRGVAVTLAQQFQCVLRNRLDDFAARRDAHD